MAKKSTTQSSSRPPVVAVLGHVDHGKTTLLDFIRKAHVAQGEHGGITQHIGAYQVEVTSDKRKITFIDTPGHEAFAKMRSRGAGAADIAILVVAADDSVKPQTIESIKQIQAAGVSMIVALNKTDLPTAQPDKVKQDLAKHGVQVEGFGGDVPIVAISGKTGKGVPQLLEMILLVSDMKELPSESKAPLSVVVIETRLDKGRGMVASVIVKQGTMERGNALYEGEALIAKVRAMFNEHGQAITTAVPGQPVEVLGFTKLPQVGALLTAQSVQNKQIEAKPVPLVQEMPDWLKPVSEQAQRTLNIVLKTDTAGSYEAIIAALNPRVRVVAGAVGEITEADILQAKSSQAFVVGFNVKPKSAVEKLAQTEKVIFRTYTIIYELLDELTEVVSGMREVLAKERELGIGQIIAEFPFEGERIVGTKVLMGRIARGDQIKIMRGKTEIGRAKIKSVRRGKTDTTKVEEGADCGIQLDRIVDFALGDAIIAVTNA